MCDWAPQKLARILSVVAMLAVCTGIAVEVYMVATWSWP